jgi:hypothetical protein
MPRERMTPAVRDWAGVLHRKFGDPDDLLKRSRRSWGGFVGSTIPHQKRNLISDRQWLKIVKQDWSRRSGRWKQMGPNAIGEVKPETLAGDLATMARQQPRRFAALALKFPRSADRQYIRGARPNG